MARVRTGMAFQELAGGMGDFVVSPGARGLVLRRRPVYKFHPAPVQVENSERMKQASAVWSGLTPEQGDAWHDYAQTLWKTGYDGNRYHPTGRNAFLGLAMKVLQVDGAATVPVWPPESDFLGDRISVSASSIDDFSETTSDERRNDGSDLPNVRKRELPEGQSRITNHESQSPANRQRLASNESPDQSTHLKPQSTSEVGILYTSTGANSAGVVTELMVQPLASGLRRPSNRYRLAEFFAFTEEALERFVPMPPGWYACAWRQVRAATGQMTDWEPLGKVFVN